MCELEDLFRALSDERRRHVLVCLDEHRNVSLADLAEFVVERERNEPITEIPSETVREVYFALYHSHVPKLEAAGLVDYEQADDVVAQTEQATARLCSVREFLNSLLGTPERGGSPE